MSGDVMQAVDRSCGVAVASGQCADDNDEVPYVAGSPLSRECVNDVELSCTTPSQCHAECYPGLGGQVLCLHEDWNDANVPRPGPPPHPPPKSGT